MAPASAPGNGCGGFRPIPVEAATGRPVTFWLRCLVDLQLATIVKHLRPALGQLTGDVLDVGAGQAPWRGWLPTTTTYHGIDIATAYEFGMDRCRSDITYSDGKQMPLNDAAFDAAICIEVLEHSKDPQVLAGEIARVLKPRGTLLLTAPWSARLHHLPHDYHRFTRIRLQALLAQAGFEEIQVLERGNDVGAIANKLTVLAIRLFRPHRPWHAPWAFVQGVASAVLAGAFVVAAHVFEALAMGSEEDPVGYFVKATRKVAR